LPQACQADTGSLLALNEGFAEEKPLNDVFCVLSAAFALALNARVYDSSRTTTTPE
jgi:hypothetical protein